MSVKSLPNPVVHDVGWNGLECRSKQVCNKDIFAHMELDTRNKSEFPGKDSYLTLELAFLRL